MADSKLIGNDFFLRIKVNGTYKYVVCEQNSDWNEDAEPVTVLCKNTGPYPEILPGGTKSGSISFTGAYIKDPTGDISFIELRELLGTIVEYGWGGIEPGDDLIEGEAHVSNVSAGANTNEAITFSATLTFSKSPVASKVSA